MNRQRLLDLAKATSTTGARFSLCAAALASLHTAAVPAETRDRLAAAEMEERRLVPLLAEARGFLANHQRIIAGIGKRTDIQSWERKPFQTHAERQFSLAKADVVGIEKKLAAVRAVAEQARRDREAAIAEFMALVPAPIPAPKNNPKAK